MKFMVALMSMVLSLPIGVANEMQQNPNDINEWYEAAFTHSYRSAVDNDKNEALEAIDRYEQVLKFDPSNRSSLMSLSALYAADLDDILTSLMYLEKVLEIDPKDTEALMAKASHLEKLGIKDRIPFYI